MDGREGMDRGFQGQMLQGGGSFLSFRVVWVGCGLRDGGRGLITG